MFCPRLYQNTVNNNTIQGNNMKKSFTHYTIGVMSLVVLMCNEKILSYSNQHKKNTFLKHNGQN